MAKDLLGNILNLLQEENVNNMTLRDHFASLAMHGELSSQDEFSYWENQRLPGLAKRAYKTADAMLAERNKNEE